MARKWTDAQKNAIDSQNGTVLVSAAAGSGKTAVLVERVIQRITDANNPVDIEKLLIVTFTIDAAAEMKSRLSERLSELIKEQPNNQYLKRQKMYLPNAQISTTDSFCNRLVKEHFEQLNITPDYNMLSDVEHEILKSEVAEEVLEEIYSRPKEETEEFLNLFTSGKDDRELVDAILKMYSCAVASQNPQLWIKNAFKEYNEKIPVHKTRWGQYLLSHLEEVVEYTKARTQDIINDSPEGSTLVGVFEKDLSPIIVSLDNILKKIHNEPEKWNEIKLLVEALSFDRIPSVPKDDKTEVYNDLKNRRDAIRDKYFPLIKNVLVCTEEEFYDDMDYLCPIMKLLQECVSRFVEILDERKKESNTYYFSDIQHFSLKLLINFNEDGTFEKTDLAKEISETFHEIYIDESQDNNGAQDALFSAISRDDKNKFMVGDVKQSIYSFRQAMPEIFLNYKDSFCEYDGVNYPATINLDKNFRSKKGVVEGINFFFDFLMTKKTCGIDYKNDGRLEFGANYNPDETADVSVHVLDVGDDEATSLEMEAYHIGSIIKDLISSETLVGKNGKERPIKYNDICILMRAVKEKAPIVARVLTEMGIPTHYEAKNGFFTSREIVTLISMLRIIDNPVQDVALTSVLLSPLCAFTEDDLSRYRTKDRKSNLYNLIKNQCNEDSKAKEFFDMLYILRTLSVTMDIGSLIRRILEMTSYDAVVGAMDNGDKRILNIERLIGHAENYEAMGGSGLSGFIRYLDKIRKNKGDFESASELTENDDVVTIKTIHKSKGLEFPVVFLINCASTPKNDTSKIKINKSLGVGVPHYFSNQHKEFTTLSAHAVKQLEKQEELAEKIRLLYVAMTRAEEKLYIIGSMSDAEKKITTLYNRCYANFLEPAVPMSMCSNLMQWIVLAMLHHPALKMSDLICCTKNPQSPKIDFQIINTIEKTMAEESEEKTFEVDNDMLNDISEKLSYEYPFAALSEIPIKYAASLMKRDENLQYLASERPAFMGKDELTPSQRVSLMHRFMEICNVSYASEDVEKELLRLVEEGKFSEIEADAIDKKKLEYFFESDMFKRISSAEIFLKEQEFAMNIPASMVIDNLPKFAEDEKVVVQGIIDGLIINGNRGEIIDYKTDNVSDENEIINRYKEQMRVYKMAAEQCFSLSEVNVTLYSFSLSKEISVKLEKNT